MEDPLDSLISDVILRVERGTSHWQHARAWATTQLRMADELDEQADLAVRLRVALSLCPVDAVTHRRSDRLSRVEKISRYLIAEQLVPEQYAARLAEAVDRTLDAWQVERTNVAGFRSLLLERDGSQCQCCRVDFNDVVYDLESVKARDPFKLGWANPERHFEPNVDHREPVSKFGTNRLDNLWLLCRFCNEGKGDGGLLLLKHELEFAAALPWTRPTEPPTGLLAHSGRLTYRVLARGGFACGVCGGRQSELTIRKTRARGLAVLSNMIGMCFACTKQP